MTLVLELPLQSVTVTVTELIPGPSGVSHGGDWVFLSDDCGQQLSAALTRFVKHGTRQLETVTLVGPVSTGPVLSKPMTLTEQLLELPHRSMTVTVTNWLSPETIVPLVGDCMNTNWLVGVQLSVALAETAGMTS